MNYTALIIGTILILLFSWFLSIKHKRYHGIVRFFSFESIFILVLLNIHIWFKDPFSPLQVISWLLFILSIYIAVAGFILLKKVGKPDENFENTSVLVKEGLYKYIRHPLYLSLFILGTGVMLKDPKLVQLILGIVNLLAVYITARIEEKRDDCQVWKRLRGIYEGDQDVYTIYIIAERYYGILVLLYIGTEVQRLSSISTFQYFRPI